MPSYNHDTKEKMQSSFGGRRRGAPNPGIGKKSVAIPEFHSDIYPIGNLVGSPFAFATVSIAVVSVVSPAV